MSVTITVSEVRTALYQASGSASGGGGARSTALLGQWFHEVIRALVGHDPHASLAAALADAEPDLDAWKKTLIAHVYTTQVGPRLTRQQAALHEVTPEILDFWQAIQAACHWLAELSWTVHHTDSARSAVGERKWQTLAECFATEEPLMCELREPSWSDSVRLVGVADAVLRPLTAHHWCALEFKLGQTSPEADLGQACLYHLMLSHAEAAGAVGKSSATDDQGTLALISFRPERHEQLFSAAALASARQRLIELIGQLAGVADSSQVRQNVADVMFNPNANGVGETWNCDLRAHADGVAVKQLFQHVRQNLGDSSPEPNNDHESSPRISDEHRQLGQQLVRTFAEYGVTVAQDGDVVVGPTFLRFPMKLGRGTKVKSVTNCAAELQTRLALTAEPFINRDGGRLVVDVQRPDRQTVWFEQVRGQLPPPDPRLGCSRIPVGVNLYGHLQFADLAETEHAHLLVAGTTGSGKSEWLRMAVAGLLLTNSPDTLRLLVIDPKRNAFHALRESRFLWRPIVFPDEQSASDVLRELADEMDRRYQLLDGADTHAELAARSRVPLPRIVCVCDEYFDLINRNRAERKLIEEQVCRLGAKARAAGIHLILATQQPSRETIKGTLDSNIPARVGLRMQKRLESTMLLSDAGAERLLGHGDLLFKDIGLPQRLQAPLLTPDERDAIFHGR
ncbi:MAG: DNA translocase FtsK [Planctomycetaceae bacterium]